jgi:ABC-2 type transport system ATP-binding protein
MGRSFPEGPIFAALAQVTKSFGANRALDNASFTVGEGEVVALLGPNGAGKSTAIAVLLGLRRPDSGTARLFGADPRLACSRRLVGVTPQDSAFPPTLRVREVIELVRAHFERSCATSELRERFGLEGIAGRQLGGLSGGERRRVGVALAFVGAPRLVVLDEPTSGLDRETRAAVWDAVRSHKRTGGSVLLTTHHLDEAEALAERVVLIDRGAVAAEGAVGELKAGAGLTVVRLRAVPGTKIEGARPDGDFVQLLVPDGGAAVRRLVQDGVPLVDLEVRPLTLEEALAAQGALR